MAELEQLLEEFKDGDDNVFANYLGVSKKTVEAWELGRTHPTGPAYRLIDILNQGKENELSFVRVE